MQETYNDLNFWKTSAASLMYLIDEPNQKAKRAKSRPRSSRQSHHNNQQNLKSRSSNSRMAQNYSDMEDLENLPAAVFLDQDYDSERSS